MAVICADLRGIRAKLRRAKEHCGTLESEINTWGKQQANIGQFNIRRDGSWYVVTSDPIPTIPDVRFSVIVGDILHNIRSALDHLVWQLVLRDGHEPTTRNEFPIYESRDKFFDEVKFRKKKPQRSVLYGIAVDGDAWTIIERAQPYQGIPVLLTIIKRFSNMDKHKTLCAQLNFADIEDIRQAITWNPDAILLEERFSGVPLSLEKETELARYHFSDQPDPNVHVKARLPIDPTFGEGPIKGGYQANINIIDSLIDAVTQVIDQVSRLPRVIDI